MTHENPEYLSATLGEIHGAGFERAYMKSLFLLRRNRRNEIFSRSSKIIAPQKEKFSHTAETEARNFFIVPRI